MRSIRFGLGKAIILCAAISLVAACSSPATPLPPTVAPTSAPTVAAAQAAGVAVKDTVAKAVDLKDYVASDPALVGTTGRPQVVEFFAFWCVDCQAERPTIHSLQDEYGQMVDFVYLDIDSPATKPLRDKMAFNGLRPTIVFLDNTGAEHSRFVGVHSKNEIANQIDMLLAAG